MAFEQVIGIIITILLIIIIAIILNTCFKCDKIIKIYPEQK